MGKDKGVTKSEIISTTHDAFKPESWFVSPEDAQRIARIQQFLDKWTTILSLTDWDITWQLDDKLEGASGEGALARVTPVWPYKRAHIRFVRTPVDSAGLATEIETFVIHELCHLVVGDLWQKITNELGEGAVAGHLHEIIETILDMFATGLQYAWYKKPRGVLYSPIPTEGDQK